MIKLYYIIIIAVFIMLGTLYLTGFNQYIKTNYQNSQNQHSKNQQNNEDLKYKSERVIPCKAIMDIQMPENTTAEMLFRNEYNICPKYNGNYSQCTNNNMPMLPAGACQYRSRIFDVCPPPFRVSEKKLYEMTGVPIQDVPNAPIHYPNPNNHQDPYINNVRVNMWRNHYKQPSDWMIQAGKGVKHVFTAGKTLFQEYT